MAAKILLVEDDNNLREIYEARLQAEGYGIVTAKDGEEALVVAKAEKPDLIIADVMMPRISGFEMLDILRNTEELKYTKVIMLTALGQAEDKTRASSLGADCYLVKSQVTLEDIVKAAHELIDEEASRRPAANQGIPNAPIQPPPPPLSAASPTTAPTASPLPTPPPPLAAPSTNYIVTPQPTMATPSVTPIKIVEPPARPQDDPLKIIGTVPLPPVAPSNAAPPPATAVPPIKPLTPSTQATVTPQPVPEPTTTSPTNEPARPRLGSNPMLGTPTPIVPSASQNLRQPETDEFKPATTNEEKAAVGAQIDSFMTTAGQDDATNTPTATPPPSNDATTADDALKTAVVSLASPEGTQASTSAASTTISPSAVQPQQPVTPPSTVAPTYKTEVKPPSDAIGNYVNIANKKVIRPIKTEPKPGLDELLAREEMKSGISIVASNPATTIFSPTGPTDPPMPEPITPPPLPPAAPASQSGVVEPTTIPVQTPPNKPADFDPNNIAL